VNTDVWLRFHTRLGMACEDMLQFWFIPWRLALFWHAMCYSSGIARFQMDTVLVADGCAALRRLYLQELAREGYGVVCAATAAETIKKMQTAIPDLIIIEPRMPDMSIPEAMECLGKEKGGVPVVVNTANSLSPEDLSRCPIQACLTKSSDVSELKETVRRLLSSKLRTV
jgi:CheY-like chemotaxis protein